MTNDFRPSFKSDTLFWAPQNFSDPFAVDLKTTYLLKSCDNDFRPSFESDTLLCASPIFSDPFALDII